MEDIFTLLLIIFVIYIVYQYAHHKKIKKLPPCKIIYKIEEEKNVL